MSANLSYAPPFGAGQPGSQVYGGGGTPLVGAHSIMDARRMMLTGRAPQANYPDGYLGTIIDRRQDRLMTALQGRVTERNYQRGVHKGVHIDYKDYYWTRDLNLYSGLDAEEKGKRWTVTGQPAPERPHIPTGAGSVADQFNTPDPQIPPSPGSAGVINPRRTAQLAHLRPAWR